MSLLPTDVRHYLQSASFEEIEGRWEEVLLEAGAKGQDEAQALLARADRFYLLTVLLNRLDAKHPWLYARCREVEARPDGHLDLWAREHYKSTIITFAGSIQEILKDPEITIGIFSHTRPDAAKFLAQIKGELETNKELQALFPDILYKQPHKDSQLWSVEKGIVVKRQSNPREATVEAHGVVETQPVGSHFRLMIFDDLVTPASVATPDQVKKTIAMHALADNLGARGPDGLKRKWHIGTRYTFADPYQNLLDRKSLEPRIYPATDDGTRDGTPVLLTPEAWEITKRDQPTNVLAAQMLQNPAAGNEAMFKKEWLKFADIRPATLNVAIMCDPASSRKKGSDDTVIHVWGMDVARNRFLLDGFHHKMGLAERWTRLRDLYKKWTTTPGVLVVKVGYERYGSTSDLEYFTERMEIEKDSFEIVELAWPLEGPGSKYDRIQRLEPDFRQGKVYLAALHDEETRNQTMMRQQGQAFLIYTPTRRQDHEGNVYNLNQKFLNEYLYYPYSVHDDGLDTASRWNDMEMHPPIIINERDLEPEVFVD
jgi:phage terminase large subunit-like protein